ncbi:MAG TPA: hypothetical protein O0W88_01850 [Methanocorpusculum sp.]|nr:hypothetical protein [Methanocorpusculum sp.]
MAVQTKSNISHKPRPKKNTNWMQVGVVTSCVFLVIMCILSFSNFGNIFNQNGGTHIGTIEMGQIVAVDYTMYIGDIPMITSSIDVYNASPVDKLPTVTESLGLVAGHQMDVANGTPILINSSYGCPFRMLNQEYNQISTGVVGLGIGELKTVKSFGSFFQTTYTKDQSIEMGIDYTNWSVGMMGLMNFPVINTINNTTMMAIRPVLVTNKTDEEMVIQYGYDTIDMKIVQVYQLTS